MKEDSPYVAEEEKYDDINYAREELDKLTLAQLIERWDKSYEHEGEGKILNAQDYWNCQIEIRNRLGVARPELINEAIAVILNKIDKLEAKFRNHRHDNTKSYGGKAEY